ncbi:hypothetical protein KVR01_011521 [Diaporthe batatas]|uniref:uncharacterized protein n=1 Tax=Diaporthe batatas TaxID=748121 RepID=UPI001D045E49|nr:uncharacterized protein KVR01_011521 [Diaporthe batatas]KAG8158399.1 hypothetical protein KVR01_011521 [Diaporthe batatas]
MNKDVLILMAAYEGNIGAAISARFIMNNDLSSVFDLARPYLIWYPLWPQRETLEELAEMCPSMRLQVAHACIVADYRMQYDKLQIRPSWILWQEAKNSHNPYYKEDLERRSAELGFDVSSTSEENKVLGAYINPWCTNRDKEPTDRFLWHELSAVDVPVVNWQGGGIYGDGYQANAKDYNLFICTSAALRAQLPKHGDGWTLYEGYE